MATNKNSKTFLSEDNKPKNTLYAFDFDNTLISNNGNIYFWGGSTKTLMFLCHCKSNNMLLDKIKFIVDIDFKKQNHYLQIVNKKIISPNKLKKLINPNDLIVVSNSNYIKEVKQTFIKKLKFNIKCISLD